MLLLNYHLWDCMQWFVSCIHREMPTSHRIQLRWQRFHTWSSKKFHQRKGISFDGLALSSTNTTWSPRMTYSNCSRIWTYFCIYWNVTLVLIVGHINYYDSHILYQSLNKLKNWKWQLTRSLMNILQGGWLEVVCGFSTLLMLLMEGMA